MAGVTVNLLPKTRSHGFLRLDFWENVKPLSVTTTWNDCAALTLQYGASARARAVACPRQPLVPVRRARVHRTARLGSRPQAREQRLDPSFPPGPYEAWLDERDARVPAPPDPRVRLVTESGSTVGSTRESNAERMASALEPCCGPLSVVPA
jgi:hypothetical protein